jgi:hypothetical protein
VVSEFRDGNCEIECAKGISVAISNAVGVANQIFGSLMRFSFQYPQNVVVVVLGHRDELSLLSFTLSSMWKALGFQFGAKVLKPWSLFLACENISLGNGQQVC